MRAPFIRDHSSQDKSRLSAQLSNTNFRPGARKAVSFLFLLAVLLFSFPTAGFAQQPPPIFNDAGLEVFVPGPLSAVAVLEPSNLFEFVKDKDAAIRLGKALFWDMSVGSDGKQACASCHFHAGADPRSKNQLNPLRKGGGINIDPLPGGPNYQLDPNDFPFVNFLDPNDRFSLKTNNVHDVVSSQGVALSEFLSVTPGTPVDTVLPLIDPVFNVGGLNTRRVEPRNTPSVINAVHNLRNFLDGRAAASFNGSSPLGIHDPNAGVFIVDPNDPSSTPTKIPVSLATSSLASQAVGPPESDFEMSARGRTFPHIGKKMLTMQPLNQQFVDPTDSVLGSFAAGLPPGSAKGLSITTDPTTNNYKKMIEDAFLPKYLSSEMVTIVRIVNGVEVSEVFEMTEANFSLFFGLAIQLYEATLISDDAKFDQVRRGETTLDADEKRGLEIFTNIGQNTNPDIPVTFCAACHLGTEFTGAAIGQIGLLPLVVPGAFAEAGEFLVERMPSAATTELGTLVYSTAPLPDQVAFPSPATSPDFTDDFTDPVNSPLHKGKIQVNPSTVNPGQGTFKIEIGDVLTKQGQVHTLFLEPRPELPEDPELILALSVTAGGDVTFELSQLGLPAGSYDVTVNGSFLGNIEAIPNILYDLGFYNIGVTPSGDDRGLGAPVPGPNPDLHPLSFSLQKILGVPEAHILDGVPTVLDIATGLPLTLPPSLPGDNAGTALVNGSFKVPGLRNVELTAPYFHNGGKRTLCEVLEFYNRGGDFHGVNLLDLDPTIQNLGMTSQDIVDVIAFLRTLTDDRVRFKRAPFDHPQLEVALGHIVPISDSDSDGIADDDLITIPAVGAGGTTAIDNQGFLGGGVGACVAGGPDTTDPVITAPADITVISSVPVAVNIGTASATDDTDPSPVITNDAPALFPLGSTMVTWTATDALGNFSTATQNVTVTNTLDTTAPEFTFVPGGITAPATGPLTPVDIGTATATDTPNPAPTVTNNAPTVFPVGPTTVTWTATDGSGNSVTDSTQIIIVTDTTAPVITAPADVTSVGQPVGIGTATATDDTDPSPVISNDAPAAFPLGTTVVTWTATDASGNPSLPATQNVTVNSPPPPGSSIHVADLDGSTIPLAEGKWRAVVSILISDENGAPVDGAAVSATWTWIREGKQEQKTGACTTSGGGLCTITSNVFEKATSVTFAVTGVSHTLTYDETANTDPDGDSDGTSITINQP